MRTWSARVAARPSFVAPGLMLMVLATLLGGFVRLYSAVSADFPVNDGGLFYRMLLDLRANNFLLPDFTTYNGGQIPFTYPPLAFYATLALAQVTGWDLLALVRVVPAVVSVLSVPAFCVLARKLAPTAVSATIASLAFALLPTAFEWSTMGGGLTRAPAYVFALLTLSLLDRAWVRDDRRSAMLAGVGGALTALSHPATAWFLAYSGALLLIARGRTRRGLMHACVAATVAALGVLPWAATLIARHGAGPLLAAFQTGSGSWSSALQLFKFSVTDEPFVPVLAVAGLFGLLVCMAERRWLLPAWLLACFVLTSRSPATFAAPALALLAGIALDRLIVLGLAAIPSADTSRRAPLRTAQVSVACVLVAYALMAAWYFEFNLAARVTLRPADRSAFSWAADNLPRSAVVLVIAGRSAWDDSVAEWFPALAGRLSPLTTQGYEWVGGERYRQRLEDYADAQACANEDAECLDDWSAVAGVPFGYVYLPSGDSSACCLPLRRSLRSSTAYALVYDGPGAVIFERRGGDGLSYG